MALKDIRAEDEVFLREGALGVGAVREVRPDSLLVWLEGWGEATLGAEHVAAAHDGKVVLDPHALPDDMRDRLLHAHDGEFRDPAAIAGDQPPPRGDEAGETDA
ncbi:hypothetical protein JQC91_13185 [Jannaschia sp. Os4]|uniref:hypothetical protein n=1 Tax=Jannaschia sp. Os4 TaxID=2807617 RepID=UPI00193A8DDC|nr:hypothetical protein [Jannaschia sp. Os4]MBM2577256.1 hypothetical protein [Jannaschia sp. Os4]